MGRRRACTLRPCFRLVALCTIWRRSNSPFKRPRPSHHPGRIRDAARPQEGFRPAAARPANGTRTSSRDSVFGKASRCLPVRARRPHRRVGFSRNRPAASPKKHRLGDRLRFGAHAHRPPRPLDERRCRRPRRRGGYRTITQVADGFRTPLTPIAKSVIAVGGRSIKMRRSSELGEKPPQHLRGLSRLSEQQDQDDKGNRNPDKPEKNGHWIFLSWLRINGGPCRPGPVA